MTVLCGLGGFEGVGGGKSGVLSVDAEAIAKIEGFLDQLINARSHS